MKKLAARILILSIVLSGILLWSYPQSVEAGGLTGWNWRKRFDVSNCSYTGNAYVIYLNVKYGSGSDTGSTVYLDGKCQADFDDIRFTSSDMSTQLKYVIVEKTDSSEAHVWVKVGAIGSGGTFYIQYGNPTANDGSNGDQTFLLYDDFNDASFDESKWGYGESTATAYYTESGGYLKLYCNIMGHFNVVVSDDTFSGGVAMEGDGFIDTLSSNGAIRWGVATYQSGQPYGSTFPRIISANGYMTGHSAFVYYFEDAGGNSGYLDYSLSWDTNDHRFTAMRESSASVSEVELENEYHNSTVYTFADDVHAVWSNLYCEDSGWDWIGVRPYVTDEPTVSSWGEEQSNEFDFEITNRELPNAPGFYYCFAKEKYYFFQARFYNDSGWDAFSDFYCHFMDQDHNVTLAYNVDSGRGSILSGSEIIQISNPSLTEIDENRTYVTWGVYFTENSQDDEDIDVYLGAKYVNGSLMAFEIVEIGYFNIYNVGGRTQVLGTSESGRLPGGDFFDLWAANGTSAIAYITFRNVIHVKMCPEVNATIGSDGAHRIYYELQWISNDDSDWITGFYVVFYTDTWYMGGSRWIEYNYELHSNGSTIKTGKWCLYHSPGTAADESTQQRFWVDLWFNAENFSSTAGIRLNAYFYPMKDESSNWLRWLTGSNWGPNEAVDKDIMLFASLYDGNGDLMYLSDVKLMRIKCKLESYTEPSDIITLSDYEVFDLTYSQGYPLKGIQTPQLDATQVPRLEQGGIFGAIWSAISSFAKIISDFFGPVILSWAEILVDWLDTAAGFFGYPNFFSKVFGYLGNLWDGFLAGIVAFGSILGNGLAFMGEWLSSMVSILNDGLIQWLSMFQMIVDMIGGAYGVGVDLWDVFNLPMWITVALIFYPLYLLIMWDEHGTDRVISHLKAVAWVPTLVFKFLSWMIMGFISILSAVIEAIPIAE